MTPDEMKQLIHTVFSKVIEDIHAKEAVYEQYFSKEYIQHVDGKTLNYADFVSHMTVQKSVMRTIQITFKHLLVDGDKIATVHLVDGVKKNGGSIKAQVNAVFQIKNRKIVLCDELTRLIEGAPSDRDLGSRH
jgi:predicted SnoaL-like aldol condensation-catalyzing enzyme